jgi:hypothetical protein
MTLVRHALCCSALLLVAACGSTGGGRNAAGHVPDAPLGVAAGAQSDAIALSWSPVAGARSYTVYWSTQRDVTPRTGTPIPATATGVLHRPEVEQPHYYVVTASNDAGESAASAEVSAMAPLVLVPAWANVAPMRVLAHAYDGARSETDNGAALRSAIARLQPGDRIEIAAGRYSIAARFGIALTGTAKAPIWITAQTSAQVVITRHDASQNTLNVDFARYVVLQGLEVTGGDTAVKLYDCEHLWLDGCHVHHCGGVAIAANSAHTAFLTITRNEVHDTAGSGEGMYLGANNGQFVTHDSLIATNHVYRCGGSQGDGIELKQGSYNNRIAGNEVHDTNYPCILVYGTAGREPNLVEHNVCYRSNDNVLQVQGEAIVRNNALFGGGIGFHSHDHQGQSRDLVFVHNTVLTTGRGANLQSWSGRPGMVFANNVIYSSSGSALSCNGSAGVTFSANVVLGRVSGTTAAFLAGTGLADFDGASYDGTTRDVRPAAASVLPGTGDPAFATPLDLVRALRTAPFTAGCRQR